MRNALNTQEIARVLGTLCQELGAETHLYIFYYLAIPTEKEELNTEGQLISIK